MITIIEKVNRQSLLVPTTFGYKEQKLKLDQVTEKNQHVHELTSSNIIKNEDRAMGIDVQDREYYSMSRTDLDSNARMAVVGLNKTLINDAHRRKEVSPFTQ